MLKHYATQALKVKLLSNRFPGKPVVVSLLSLLLSSALQAGPRPATANAACDDLARSWNTSQSQSVEREVNFHLFDASDLGCLSVVEQLLDAGASVQARDRAGNTAFMLAASKGHDDIVDLLLEKGADPRQTNLLGSNALIMAVTHNRRKTARHLLALGLDVNVADGKSITPLVAAAYNGNLRMLNMLLNSGADSTIVDASGKSAIVYAAGRGYIETVKQLLEHSDKIEANTRYGNNLTALMWAAGHGNDVPAPDGLAVVEYLLAEGADPDLMDNRGRNALHIAAERGHTSIVERLVKIVTDVNAKDADGNTPLGLTSNPAIRQVLENAATKERP